MAETYDILGQLPIEISQKILMPLSPENLGKVLKCCKRWKDLLRGSYFWKQKFEKNYHLAGSEYVESECYQKYVKNFSTFWQGHYMYNLELENNWKNGLCKKISLDSILDLHSFVYMNDDMLIVAKTHEICIINISNGLIEKTFQAVHLIRALVEKSEGSLIALCHNNIEDNTSSLIIKVWDLKINEIRVNFEHQLFLNVSKLHVYKHLIAFLIYEDSGLYIFNIKKKCFDYQRQQIGSICFGSDTIAIRTGPNLIETLDLNFNVLMELTCCDDKNIRNFQIKNNYLFVACMRLDGWLRFIRSICVWDLTANSKLYTIEDGQYVDLTFIDENKIICLKRCLAENWLECLSLPHFTAQTICQKRSEYYLYTSNNRFLFTEITETSLKMWCPKTQKLIRSIDLKGFNTSRYFYSKFVQIDILMVSNKNLAYVESVDGNDVVHILDFGPDIKNKITFS